MKPINKIFITGATGFIGKHLIMELSANNQLILLTRKIDDFLYKHPNVTWIEGDISLFDKISYLLKDCNFFIHIAGEKKDESKMKQVNVESMKLILAEIQKYPDVKFIQISSAGVYGIEHHPEDIITEISKCFPINLYEKTKYEAEQLLINNAKITGLKYCILRPSNVFGEYDKGKKLLNFFHKLKKGLFFFISLKARTNYVYVKDLARVIEILIRTNKIENEIYNINSPANLKEMVNIIKSEIGVETKNFLLPRWLLLPIGFIGDYLPKRIQLFNSIKFRELTNNKIYSADKISNIVPLNNPESLYNGLRNLVRYYRENKWL